MTFAVLCTSTNYTTYTINDINQTRELIMPECNYVYTSNENSKRICRKGANIINNMKKLQRKNYEKLQIMRGLKHNWNGENGLPISKDLIDKTEQLLDALGMYQPNVFPTPNGGIQLEFYNGNDNYLQFTATRDGVEYYKTDSIHYDDDEYEEIGYNICDIVQRVRSFYNNIFDTRTLKWEMN